MEESMKVGTLVRIDPLCPISIELEKVHRIEYERELKWIGIVVEISSSIENLYSIQWAHMLYSTSEYGDYLEVLCE
jgi:hypothetical protein|tara:strand:- start:9444 stop:9671 length:228 start_codon:yes stop_codon:yes gene_type:complete